MSQDLEFKMINSFTCKRCGCTNYDKLMYTGFNTLDEDDAIVLEKYVCRNCDLPFYLEDYMKDTSILENIKSSPTNLINTSTIIDEGVENKSNNKGE